MVFCGSGGMATVPPVDGGVGAAVGGGAIWLVSGCLAAAGVVAGAVVAFFAFFVVEVAALGVDALAFFRHALRADVLFWLWQEVEDFDLAAGTGAGVGEDTSWANEEVANETAARAARPAIKRRMKITPGPLAEGDGTASIWIWNFMISRLFMSIC